MPSSAKGVGLLPQIERHLPLIKYVLFPKTFQAVLYRVFYYLPPAAYALSNSQQFNSTLFTCLATYLLIEGIFCTSRNVMNDLKDFADDQARGGRWKRFVNARNRSSVRVVLALKLCIGAIAAWMLQPDLLYVAALLMATQYIYDWITKPNFPLLSVVTVACGYMLRSASVFVAVDDFSPTRAAATIIVLSGLAALYQAVEWRRSESLYILERRLVPKSGTDFFSSSRGSRCSAATRSTFVLAVVAFGLATVTPDVSLGVWLGFAAIVVLALNTVLARRVLAAAGSQVHNLFALVLCAVLFPHEWLTAACLVTVVPLCIYHHSVVSIEQSASRIFDPSGTPYRRSPSKE